jgi:penicillin-binding protein 1A
MTITRRLRRRFIALALGLGGLALLLVTTLPELPTPHDPGGQKGKGVINFLGVNGELIARRGSSGTAQVALDELPAYLPAAVLAIEDRRFRYHPGVDPIAVVRAFQANRKAGRIVQGGSTITQQTAKLMFLDAERTWRRKWREFLLALSLEIEYSKDEILELYLNRAYLGSGNYGIEMASWDYFGKSARDLTLPESAMLAGLLQAPSRYAPTRDRKLARQRAGVVLDAMVATGSLQPGMAEAARAFPAALAPPLEAPASSYFVDWIVRQLPDSLSNLNIDLNIITTLDPHAQAAAEARIEQVLAESAAAGAPGIDSSQAALVMLAPNGAIRAMVGGRSYRDSQFNRATDARRQPGSAFKPFVYMTALEQGYAPENQFYDEPVTVANWSPENYAGEYRGRVTLTEALAGSINSVAVKLSEVVGRDAVIETARRCGIEADLEPLASLPLGTHELSLLELTAAYAPFANGGYRAFPYGLLEVRTTDGALLYSYSPPPATRVAERRVVRDMNRMLAEVVLSGTGRAAALGERPVAVCRRVSSPPLSLLRIRRAGPRHCLIPVLKWIYPITSKV